MVKSDNLSILHISKRSFYPHEGLTYSVPNQIYYQNQLAEVYWYNANHKKYEFDQDDYYSYNKDDFPIYQFGKFLKSIQKPDLVIFQELYFLEYLYIALLLNIRKIPYIIIPHGCLTESAQKSKRYIKWIANMFYRRFLKKAKAIHFLSEQEKSQSHRYQYKKSIVIPNGITMPKESKKWSKKRSTQYTGVFIGRKTIAIKGLDLLLNACRKVREELIAHNIHFALYGPATQRESAALQALIHDNDLSAIVELHEGIFGREKYAVLLESDLFLLTSRTEGHPMGLLEALSVGLPSLVTQGTSMKEIVVEHNAGWGADNSVESIEAALKQLIRDVDKLPEIGANALQLAKRYNWKAIAEQAVAKYKDLLDEYTL